MFSPANAQLNLVRNGSFELRLGCPSSSDQLDSCAFWFNPNNASPDYYNACSPYIGVPSHAGLYQQAKTGAAYTGVFTFAGSGNGREYIEGSLIHPLQAGRKYCVSFYVNLMNNMIYATDAFGAYLSNDTLRNDTNSLYFPVQPQVENPTGNIITDTLNWTLISGEFIATGGERYITIGSFKPNAATNFDTTAWGIDARAYYYIDDVSVIDCDPSVYPSPAPIPQITPPEQGKDIPLVIPTLIGPSETFSIQGLPENSTLILYNGLGQLIYKNENYDNSLSGLSAGIYYCRLRLPDGSEQAAKVYFQR